MWRGIGATIAGYLTMAVLVFGSLTTAYLTMGADRAFEPGVYDVSSLWLTVHIPVATTAAALGGAVCAALSRSWRPAQVFVGLVFLLGNIEAIAHAMANPLPADLQRTGAVSNFEAMSKARVPHLVAWSLPWIVASGALAGAALVRRERSQQ